MNLFGFTSVFLIKRFINQRRLIAMRRPQCPGKRYLGNSNNKEVHKFVIFWNKKKAGTETLKIKVGGDIVRVISSEKENEFLALDREIESIGEVFKCLQKIDKSVNEFNEDEISISLQCTGFCAAMNKKFCQKIVTLMGKELTNKMSISTRVDTMGFVDYTA